MKSTLCKYLSLSALALVLLLTSGACQANNPNTKHGIGSPMDYSDSIDLKFYLVGEDELVEVISAIRSSEPFKQRTFGELDEKNGALYLVACVDNNLDKNVWGSGSVKYRPKGGDIIIKFISIHPNAKKHITVVPLGMPALPIFAEDHLEFTWKWDSLSAK